MSANQRPAAEEDPVPDEDIVHKLSDPRALTEDTAKRLVDALDRHGAFVPIRRIRGNEIASAFIGAVGLALFIVGVENAAADVPVLSNAYGSIVVGLVLLSLTGALLARLREAG
jgi:hypothetical protein